MAHENYMVAQRKRRAILDTYHQAIRVWVPKLMTEILVSENGSSWVMGQTFSYAQDAERTAQCLASAEESVGPLMVVHGSTSPDKMLQIYFLQELREGDLKGAAGVIKAGVPRINYHFDGKTFTIEYPGELGRVIGRNGRNIRRYQQACDWNGVRLVVRLSPEAAAERKMQLDREKSLRAQFESEQPLWDAQTEVERLEKEVAQAYDNWEILNHRLELGQGDPVKLQTMIAKVEDKITSLEADLVQAKQTLAATSG